MFLPPVQDPPRPLLQGQFLKLLRLLLGLAKLLQESQRPKMLGLTKNLLLRTIHHPQLRHVTLQRRVLGHHLLYVPQSAFNYI